MNYYNPYQSNDGRLENMAYRRCRLSGLKLPVLSMGLRQNVGFIDNFGKARSMQRTTFNCGIIHVGLASNYEPPAGSAEENAGRIYKKDFQPYRDGLTISSNAGWGM